MITTKQNKIEKADFDVATDVNYGVVSFLSWPKSICTSEMDILKTREPLTIIASFRR